MHNRSNLLLAALSPGDTEALQRHLRPSFLAQKTILFDTGDEVAAVYFPVDAIISLVVSLSTGEMVEAAMVGNDGAVGLSAALDGRISLSRAIVQLAGNALVCDIDALKNAAVRSPPLLSLLIRHEQALYAQAQQSAACIASHQIEARLCRWLLRARDLSGSDTLRFTQEFLAEMLGVRRSSVSIVAHTLQKAGMIKYSRGRIQITDVAALQESACECYGTIKAHYQDLFGIKSL